MTLTLSPDQEEARALIHFAVEDGLTELVLSGPAGSGKTTIMRALLEDFEQQGRVVKLIAPTGKAAARLSELTGRAASTIHAPLYREIIEVRDADGKLTGDVKFADPKAVADRRAVVICDEASMVGTRIYSDLRRTLDETVVLLCVGDREQLPPVNDTWGAQFAEPTALLTAIHRQAAGSPIIQLATAIRQQQEWRKVRPGGAYSYRRGKQADAVAWLAQQRLQGQDAALLAYTNNVRQRVNDDVREARGFTEPLHVGDLIVCTRNQYGVGKMNGEVVQVAAFEYLEGSDGRLARIRWYEPGERPSRSGPGRSAVIAPKTLHRGASQDEWTELEDLADALDLERESWWETTATKKRMMRAEYGECLTVHKSQGSQWHTVGVVYDRALEGMETRDPDTFRRMLYTAVTRAATELVLWDIT